MTETNIYNDICHFKIQKVTTVTFSAEFDHLYQFSNADI